MINDRQSLPLFKKYYSNYTGLNPAAWQGICISFIESSLIGVCYFLSIYFVTELHLTIAKAGIIMACYGIGTICGGLLGGKLSDLTSPRTVSIASLMIQAFAYLLLIKIKSPTLLMLNLFIIGIGSYGFITSNHVWTLARCKQNERLKAINLLNVVSNLGLALSGLIIGFLSTKNFSSLFLVSGFLLFATAISLLIVSQTQTQNIIKSIEKTNTADSSNTKIICFVLACLFAVGFIISQISSTYPVYIQVIFPTMGTQSFGTLLTLNAILVVLLQGPIVNQLGSFNRVLLLGLGALLLGFGLFLLNVAYAFWVAIVSCFITTTGEILFFSIAQLICYEKGPENKKGHSMGYYRTVYAASRVVGPAIGGIIYQRFGSENLWTLCFILGLFCLLSAYLFRKYN